MLLAAAILLALFVLPSPWGLLVVVAAAIVEVAEVGFWIWLSKRRSIQAGSEALIGAVGQTVTACRPEGQVRIVGELWQAHCDEGAEAGESVTVIARDGLKLHVEPIPSD